VNTNFEENKYKKLYFSIITRSQNEGREYNSSLHEKHHIVPTSLGGKNNSDNIVVLTFREHFVCHLLLTKFTLSQAKHKMHCALRMMMNKSKHNNRVLTQRQYELARYSLSKIKRKMSPEFCAKQSLNKLGKNNPMYGKKHSPETIEKLRMSIVKTSKTYNFLHNGQIITITNLKKYCEENKLIRCRMYKLHSGKIKKYKNYTGLTVGY
jgi:hypothetical protein